MPDKVTDLSSESTVHGTSRRYWRRRETPSGGWWGSVPLLGLLGVFLYGLFATAPAIEAQTAEQVRLVLLDNDLEDFSVEADGQQVLVRATGTEADSARIRGWASGAVCDTWIAERLTCPANVRVEMRAPVPALTEPEVEQTVPAPRAIESVPAERLHDFSFRRTDDAILLRGEVPNDIERSAILAEANSRFDEVTNELLVSGEPATEGFQWATNRTWPILSVIIDGEVSWRGGVYSVAGRVSETEEPNVRGAFSSNEYPGRLGELNLEIIDDPERCNKAFSDALSSSTIQFQTGSAAISADSQNLIQQLATIAQDCPDRLSVNGHTDNVGPETLNYNLSLARAQAVVRALTALGVDAERLTARGFGASQPIAENSSAAGKARNRRIEIEATASQPE